MLVVEGLSRRDTVGMTTRGGSATVAVNHLELDWLSTSTNKIIEYLSAP